MFKDFYHIILIILNYLLNPNLCGHIVGDVGVVAFLTESVLAPYFRVPNCLLHLALSVSVNGRATISVSVSVRASISVSVSVRASISVNVSVSASVSVRASISVSVGDSISLT